MLKVGTEAPDFEAKLHDGSTFRLSEERGKRHVVLYFYPKDFTTGCTREACAFRDNYDAISEHDAIIVGVSGDGEESHEGFREKHDLQFPLIADPEKEVIGLYKARGPFGLMTARITYIIDKAGVVRSAFRHDFRVGQHVPKVVEALEAMA